MGIKNVINAENGIKCKQGHSFTQEELEKGFPFNEEISKR